MLENEVENDPSIVLVGDSFIKHQDQEYCRNGAKRRHACYPGRRIEDAFEEVDCLVVNTSEQMVFVYLIEQNL